MALAVKYLFYEDWEENCRIRKTYLEELERKCVEEASESDSVSVDTNTSERFTTLLLLLPYKSKHCMTTQCKSTLSLAEV